MVAKRALVVGGTGVTGPFIVNGLIRLGYEVTIFHSGRHEVEFDKEVEHIHGDAHFTQTIQAALGKREFDVTIALYGRLRHIADVMAGRTGQFLASGGVFYAGFSRRTISNEEDPVAYRCLPMPVSEDFPRARDSTSNLISKGIASEEHVFDLHAKGRFSASVFRLPRIYGPRALAGVEWGIIRRVLDGRKRIIVPDGGMLAESRAYAENVAHMILLALEYPEGAAGRAFNAADGRATTLREWMGVICAALGASDVELVSVPYKLAFPAYPYSRDPFTASHRILDVGLARERLHYSDLVPFEEAIGRTVNWYVENRPEEGGEIERQLGDSFDYAAEDALLARMDSLATDIGKIPHKPFNFLHPYPHPVAPDPVPSDQK
jgi:nucleoside-diphosphate-sugar epimerase